MGITSLQLIGTLAKCGAGAFTVLAAVFLFLDERHQDHQRAFRSWFRAKWGVVHNSRWLALPERIITWFVNEERGICRHVTDELPGSAVAKAGGALALVMVPVLFWHRWGPAAGLAAAFSMLPPLAVSYPSRRWDTIVRLLSRHVEKRLWPASLIALLVAAVLGLQFLVGLPTHLAALVSVIAIPALWFVLGLPAAMLRDFDTGLVFGFGVALGITATFLALALGHAASPHAWVPQTMQMLVSNLICDGLTMVATFWILAAAIAGPGFLRVPRAILLNLVAGGGLAIASLYFGVVGTRHALSLPQLAHVLVARSPDGTRWEIGPYFWTMHTTFLPTLILLSLVLLAWLGKALLIPVHHFLGIGREHKNPLKLTALLWGAIAAAFTALAGIISAFLPSGVPNP